jgi:hypothetical protein
MAPWRKFHFDERLKTNYTFAGDIFTQTIAARSWIVEVVKIIRSLNLLRLFYSVGNVGVMSVFLEC